jgi:hypothetical protein
MRRECSFFAMVMFLLAGLVFSSAIATMQAWRNAPYEFATSFLTGAGVWSNVNVGDCGVR